MAKMFLIVRGTHVAAHVQSISHPVECPTSRKNELHSTLICFNHLVRVQSALEPYFQAFTAA